MLMYIPGTVSAVGEPWMSRGCGPRGSFCPRSVYLRGGAGVMGMSVSKCSLQVSYANLPALLALRASAYVWTSAVLSSGEEEGGMPEREVISESRSCW